jgi:hypothetical protein
VTWQPEPGDDGAQPPAWLSGPADDTGPDAGPEFGPEVSSQGRQGRLRRGTGWTAMVLLLGLGLCGLAAAAVGVAHQLLPRQFTAAQERQIMTWEMTRRWRALQAGQIFPSTATYELLPAAVNTSGGLALEAHRLAIAPAASCTSAVSGAAAVVLADAHCSTLLRATYVDSSGSMVVTVGVAVLPDSQAALAAAHALADHGQDLALTVRALPVARTAASRFGNSQRQLSAVSRVGPYVIMSTAGFTDGRRHVRLATDYYYDQEMSSVADGVAQAAGTQLGASVLVPKCPGAPGC